MRQLESTTLPRSCRRVLLLLRMVQFHHIGTIEKLVARENYLFVGSSEGAVTIYGKKDHAFYHTMKLHTKGMLDMDIHSTGRLMLTLGNDFKMKLVDLASMSEVYHKNINPGRILVNQLRNI
jgi:hypothetical protein